MDFMIFLFHTFRALIQIRRDILLQNHGIVAQMMEFLRKIADNNTKAAHCNN